MLKGSPTIPSESPIDGRHAQWVVLYPSDKKGGDPSYRFVVKNLDAGAWSRHPARALRCGIQLVVNV
jgi:hypothetical protein